MIHTSKQSQTVHQAKLLKIQHAQMMPIGTPKVRAATHTRSPMSASS